MIVNFSSITETQKYQIMSNTIFPRPIAWITTQDNGVVNLAPFSYFAPISSQPPCVIVSIAHKENGEPKDTLFNILKHKVCTINLAHKEQLEELKLSALALPKEQSECEQFNIQTTSIIDGFPPMVKHSYCAIFCEYVKQIDLKGNFCPLILEIKHIYLNDEVIDEKNHIHLDNIGRAGMQFLIDAQSVK